VFWTSVPAGANDDARLLAQRGQILEDQGAHEAALAAFTQAIALNALPPIEQARLLYARGIVLDVEGQLSDALGDYSAAIRLAPGFAPALNNRANLYRRQNRLSEAKRDYRASLAAGNPQPEYSWCGLGEIAEAQGDRASAEQDYARAVAANPAYQPALDRLAGFGGGASLALLQAPIHLRPPKAKPTPEPAVPPEHLVARIAMATARYEPPGPSVLRPALDSSPVLKPQVQLGAWRSEAEAGHAWDRAVRQADGLLDGLRPLIMAADLPGKGLYYRLRVAPAASATAHLCDALTVRGLACILARN
jgi:tetratricopeptide (TPR) repeat protein